MNDFNAKRKVRAAVYAVMAVQELRRRFASRARHATVFKVAKAEASETATQFQKKSSFNPRRKFRAAVYVILASNEIHHWIDSQETLLHDPSLKHEYYLGIKEVPKQRLPGEKFNPRRTMRAAVFAVMAINELQSHSALRCHVKEMLRWLGEHTTRPSFVQEFYQDLDWMDRNRTRKMRAATYAIMAVEKLQEKQLYRKKLEQQVKERLDWISTHIPEKVDDDRHSHLHYVHFRDPHSGDESMVSTGRHHKDFEAMRKAVGDTVIAPHAGMLPQHELRRAYSTE